jgi:hypothetical protein
MEKIEISPSKLNFVESCYWKTKILKAIVKTLEKLSAHKHDAKNT